MQCHCACETCFHGKPSTFVDGQILKQAAPEPEQMSVIKASLAGRMVGITVKKVIYLLISNRIFSNNTQFEVLPSLS